jgi:putative thioredoxin
MTHILKVIEVDIDNFAVKVLAKSKDLPVLVDFTADWCAPCRFMAPVLNKMANNSHGEFIIAKVDTDEEQKLAGQYGIRGFPTFKLFRHGKVVEEMAGAKSEKILREMINRHIN